MCGRIVQITDPSGLARLFDVTWPGVNIPPRYNGAPSQDMLVVRRHPETGARHLDALRWGLVPHWANEPKIGWKMINARAETVATSGAFKAAWAARRCLVPVDAFYEWKAIPGQKAKQPYAIAMKDREPFALGGLWENWRDRGSGEWLRTFAIVTTDANDLVAKLHDRMPVIVGREHWDRWLGDQPPADLLRPFPPEPMTMWPVSTRVNTPKNDEPSLLDALADPAAASEPRQPGGAPLNSA